MAGSFEPAESLNSHQSHNSQATHRPRCRAAPESGHTVVPVGLTGVIYALVVLAWAAYLLPQALRRHDEAARKHSIERFSSAMRVLARRGPSTSDRFVVTPPRTVDRVLTPSLASGTPTSPAVERPRPSRVALRDAAARRRRVLVVLLAATLGVAGVAAFGLVPLWSIAIPVTLIVVFLTLARRQVRRASDAYWDEVSDAQPEPSNVITRPATRVDASHGTPRTAMSTSQTATLDPAAGTASDDEPTVTLDPNDLKEARVGIGVVATADGGSLWDPLPVTLPTYVDKPVAKRSYRTIELGEPGTWSSGHSAQDSATAAASNETAPAKTGEASEAAAETPRAVNG